jgi:hypothetical protein
MHFFSCSSGISAVSIKAPGTHYSELVFLHRVRSVGHIVHYGAFGP